MTCPRCNAEECTRRLEHDGAGMWVWVYTCRRCTYHGQNGAHDRRIQQLLTEHARRARDWPRGSKDVAAELESKKSEDGH